MKVIRIPVLSDNYIFILFDPDTCQAVVIDPAVPAPVLAWLKDHNAQLVAIWNTHHHSDHVGANRKLLKAFPDCDVVAGGYDYSRGRIPGQSVVVAESDRLQFASREVQVFDCPGHTLGHIAYYLPPVSDSPTPHLFCGDTVFAGGCGRLFEGTAAQMLYSIDKFRQLPSNTLIWCAHEYTLSNLKFAVTVEPENSTLAARMQEVQSLRQQSVPTVPTELGVELATNPFMRWDQPSFVEQYGMDSTEIFARVRGMKDRF